MSIYNISHRIPCHMAAAAVQANLIGDITPPVIDQLDEDLQILVNYLNDLKGYTTAELTSAHSLELNMLKAQILTVMQDCKKLEKATDPIDEHIKSMKDPMSGESILSELENAFTKGNDGYPSLEDAASESNYDDLASTLEYLNRLGGMAQLIQQIQSFITNTSI